MRVAGWGLRPRVPLGVDATRSHYRNPHPSTHNPHRASFFSPRIKKAGTVRPSSSFCVGVN